MDRSNRDEPTGLTRRGLIAAAGSLMLAAGGWLLPDWREEAAAREGSYSGQLGGRHGPNRRGRDTKKRQRDQNGAPRGASNGGRPESGTHVRWITFNLYNDRPRATPNPSATIVPWARFADWRKYPDGLLPNGQAATFRLPGATESAVIVDGRLYVSGINFAVGTPQIVLARDGTMTPNGYQNADGRTIVESLTEGEQITRTVGGHTLRVTRIPDSGDYIEFDVHFT
ncbi:MAG: hypothetical protein U0031_17355 [Thermomicrobiales bacterium]